VAEVGDEVVGFSAVDGDYLGWLYVHPNHYHKGIGRKLLQNSLPLVPGEAWTIVLSENKPAIALYQSEGFNEVARFESENEGYPAHVCEWFVNPRKRILSYIACSTLPLPPLLAWPCLCRAD